MVNVPDKGDLIRGFSNEQAYDVRGDTKGFGDAGTTTGFDSPVLEGRSAGQSDTNSLGGFGSECMSDPMFDKFKHEVSGMSDIDSQTATGSESPTPVQSTALSGTDSDPMFQEVPHSKVD